jgi:AbrB family looped-hinge helix DNA binding protein
MMFSNLYDIGGICMSIATVGSRYQVVIPRAARKLIPLRPHSKVNIEVRDHCLVVYPVNVARWRGIGKALSSGKDATDYVRSLRSEWSRRA